MFDPVDPKQSFPALERGILKYWKEEDIFKRSIKQRREAHGDILECAKDGKEFGMRDAECGMTRTHSEFRIPNSSFSFYDGPPFATGLPHYGHLLAGTIKDVIPRYQTMRGHAVTRRFGWDCHGLPIENLIEKEHGISSRKDIEAMGIATFNELCRSSVQRYAKEWRETVERMGRFVDMDHDYRTMDPDYMESIWWVFASLHAKNLIYEGSKPMHICPRCATPLSNFEVGLGYADRSDMSLIMTFPLVDDPQTVLLAWTTTPWSLPGNFWLAVGPTIIYAKVREGEKTYILAENLVEKVFKERTYEVIGTVKAKELMGKRYVPLFPYFADTVIPSTAKGKKPQTYGDRVFKVVINDAVEVSATEGTGIVHLTSCTGEDSHAVATAEKVDILPHIRIDGTFIDAVTDLQGMNAKPEGSDPMATDKKIVEILSKRGRAFSHFTITHSYPHCWRCDCPLLPYTTGSWFVTVEKIKANLLANNAKTRWVPGHIRDGRFGKWLENARDWAISRNRYWGTPLPIWRVPESTNHMRKDVPSARLNSPPVVISSRDDLLAQVKIRFTKVTVLRHAQSEGNVTPIYQGNLPGTSLTERGKEQATEAAKFLTHSKSTVRKDVPSARLNPQPPTVIYCSPLDRTRQTAAIIAKETGATVIVDDRLREVSFGAYEGKHVDFSDLSFVKARRAHKLEQGKPESIYHFEGMEAWSKVQERISAFLHDVLPKHRSEHIVIVTHADPVMNIRAFFTGEDPVKLSHQPYPDFASPESYFWDHASDRPLDLHRQTVDTIAWPGGKVKGVSVDLTMVRHGQTDWNKAGICQGQEGNRHLTDLGREQALKTAKALKRKRFDGIICSDLHRARESAEIIARELNLPILEQSPLLRERSSGEWSGTPMRAILERFPLPVEDGEDGMHYVTPPGGESLTQFLKRTENAYEHILATYPGKKLLVVSHGGFMRALCTVTNNLSYHESVGDKPKNAEAVPLTLHPRMQRIPEVLDCWFESGAMPYAQQHFPFAYIAEGTRNGTGQLAIGNWQLANSQKPIAKSSLPPSFPADFIAEGIDQTRGWFYTLMVLSAALFDAPAFKNCIVNGIVLAEDGKKMSKRLKNYPEPTEIIEKHGADAVRFTLMRSPAVRGEDLRFGEKLVEETVRSVLLPLWNTYSFFVTYANAAQWKPESTRRHSTHPLDRWIRAEIQDLVNRMTQELEAYDLSATCNELGETIDALTNWYIRLSRRRFAGKGAIDIEEASGDLERGDQHDALATLYDVLLTLAQLLAPFCPFVTDAIYGNLVDAEHGSIHLTDWPRTVELTAEDHELLERHRTLRTIVSLGNTLRSQKRIKVRQPLAEMRLAISPALRAKIHLRDADVQLLRSELNVKQIALVEDPASLATIIALVDARKVGPRLGKRVQEIIAAGKRGEFEMRADGTVLILEEILSPAEVQIQYRGVEGADIAAASGIVVSLDTRITPELEREGFMRDIVRAVQKLRKEANLSFTDRIALHIEGCPDILEHYAGAIAEETRAQWKENAGTRHVVDIEGKIITITFT